MFNLCFAFQFLSNLSLSIFSPLKKRLPCFFCPVMFKKHLVCFLILSGKHKKLTLCCFNHRLEIQAMVISCQVQRLARKTAKIGFSAINSFKKKALHLMGCLCSKGAKDDSATSGHRTPSWRDDSAVLNAKFKENTFNSSTLDSYGGAKVVALDARISSGNNADLKGLSGEHVVAGWPAWLINVAPKAVEGWLPRRADSFEKLAKILLCCRLVKELIVSCIKLGISNQGKLSHLKRASILSSSIWNTTLLVLLQLQASSSLSHRPPELLLGATEYGVAVDMWSTGCILAELFAGKPIMPGRTEVEQIHKIFKLCGSPPEYYCKKSKVPETAMFKPQQQYGRCVAETFKDFPPPAVVLIDSLLSLEPEVRGTAASALESDFFRTKPLACDPSSLPKLPPSKEYDVRLRQEEARRQRNAELGGRGAESVKPGNENHVTSRAIDIAAQVKQPTHTTSKSTCEKFNPEDSVPGFRVEPRALPTSVQVPECGSTWNMRGYADHHAVPGRICSSVHVARKKVSSYSNLPQYDATNLKNGIEVTDHNQPADRPAPSQKDLQENHGRKYKRIHYSGPLMPPGGNIDDMLKEHERHIQEAVRKARLSKGSR
ncbi:probable serine/threonine-protein kinase At1g09600 isoform X8 [Panicum hallii]|uniref:probable serine/threonine-protein kinase At1g09600 isoform X8 n=1 Tax=Panicum hallii TaxID=206008 RepID=UPI000DF4D2CB|nr:probable serine/threonine-protein kinase At1g09600 isoform X8 [Panicum hallii]